MKGTFMKILLSVAMCFSIGLASPGQIKRTPTPAEVERELRNLVTTWNTAETKRDVATIEKLLAPEFSFLGGSTRKEYLEKVVPDEAVDYLSTIENVRVELYGNTAIVTTLESFKGTRGEKAAEGKLLIMTVWLKRLPGWQCIKSSIQVVKEQVQ
jgi:ketosteroid isomerase-like protein